MYDGMTEKHLNFDLSKTKNVAADIGQLNERAVLCTFCNTLLIRPGLAIKQNHLVS